MAGHTPHGAETRRDFLRQSLAAATLCVAPLPPPQPSTDTIRLFAGPAVTTETLGNIQCHADQLAMRVFAPKTGRIKYVTWYIVQAVKDITLGPHGSNYGFGTGGIIRTSLQTNTPGPNSRGTRNYPSGTIIGGSSNFSDVVHPRNQFSGVRSLFWTHTLPVGAQVTAGQIIHIVHRNVHSNPRYNYVSGDYLVVRPPSTPMVPVHDPVNPRALRTFGGVNGTWGCHWDENSLRPSFYYPIYQLTYEDGDNFGSPYINGCNEGTHGITATRWLRQNTTPYWTHTATHASLWVTSSFTGGGNLLCDVRSAAGTLLGTATHAPGQYSVKDSRGGWLREAAFQPGPVAFQAGQRYHIIWRATGAARFTSRGLQDGTVSTWSGQANRNPAWLPQSAVHGRAEYSTNSTTGTNGSWIGHTLYGQVNRSDTKLSYYLRIQQ